MMASVDKVVAGVFGNVQQCRPVIRGCAADIYWAPPEDSTADFVRLRRLDEPNERGLDSQITLKSSDKGGNVNRVEIDLGVDSHRQANLLLSMMLGDPLGQVTKRYTVYFLENQHTTISVYRVLKDKRIFVEVEATSLDRVKELAASLVEAGLSFKRVQQSLFDMFVAKKPMTLADI